MFETKTYKNYNVKKLSTGDFVFWIPSSAVMSLDGGLAFDWTFPEHLTVLFKPLESFTPYIFYPVSQSL